MAKRKSSAPRTERKEAARHRILTAAWQLVEEGKPASQLGLREVARTAGLAAPSVYNHFADMDELGLALVDDCLLRLRRLSRTARNLIETEGIDQAMKSLSDQLLDNMEEYDMVLRLLIQHWFNPNLEFRRTIRREMASMRADMTDSMYRATKKSGDETGKSPGKVKRDLSNESDAIFSLWITYILNSMDLDREKRKDRLKSMEKQIAMVLVGSHVLSEMQEEKVGET